MISEHFPYESIVDNSSILFQELPTGYKILSASNVPIPHRNIDLALADVVTLDPTLQSGGSTRRVLVLNCGEGLAGIAALQLGNRKVVFVDESADTIRENTWTNVFLNAPYQMAETRCLSTGQAWDQLGDDAVAAISG